MSELILNGISVLGKFIDADEEFKQLWILPILHIYSVHELRNNTVEENQQKRISNVEQTEHTTLQFYVLLAIIMRMH
jgi:hypothetical protein